MGNSVFALLHHDYARAVWTPRGIGAVVYLIIGGSLIGYTAYIYILSRAPATKVSTYAYVNPVVAVFLGWLVLHEKIDAFILAGSAVVIASVIVVTSASAKPKPKPLEMSEAAAD
jgi:drug/metabolite transporter (DMT)-like permease